VKIVTKALGEKYHNQKAAIIKVKDGQATVEVISTGHKLKLGEKHLQTVIPQPGLYFCIIAKHFLDYCVVCRKIGSYFERRLQREKGYIARSTC
jgi:KN17 SH3-like C-terminal domain